MTNEEVLSLRAFACYTIFTSLVPCFHSNYRSQVVKTDRNYLKSVVGFKGRFFRWCRILVGFSFKFFNDSGCVLGYLV